MAMHPPFRRPKRPEEEDDDLNRLVDARMAATPKKLTPGTVVRPKGPPAPGAGNRRDDTSIPPPPAAGLPPPDPSLKQGGDGRTVKNPGGIGGTSYFDPEWAAGDNRGDGDGDGQENAAPAVDEDQAALDALADELERSAAQNQTNAARVAGLGGFGLNGAGVGMAADIGREDADSRVLALQDLMNQQKDQDFQDIQRDAQIYETEDIQDRDLDGDGMVAGRPVGGKVGDGNPDNNPVDEDDKTPTEKDSDEIAAMSQEDFEALTQEKVTAAGWVYVETVDEDDGKSYAIWRAPDGTERRAYIDGPGESYSNGLEWKR